MRVQKELVVLLVDDDEDDREIFGIALESIDRPVRYLTAGHGREAIDLFENDHTFLPDFIFLDLNMPKMDGRQCLAEIRKLPRLNDTPVIVYSTLADNRELSALVTSGATAYMSKPSDIKILASQLSGFLFPDNFK